MDSSKTVLHKVRLYGLFTIMVVATAVAVLVASQVHAIVVRGASNVFSAGAGSLVQGCLDDTGDASLDADGIERLEAMVADRQTGQRLLGVRVVDSSGIIVYSTLPAETGSSVMGDPRVSEAFAGEIAYDIVDADAGDAMANGTEAIRVYTPLRAGSGDRVIGVAETYKPYAHVKASADEAALLVLVQVLAGAMVACFGVLWVARRAQSEVNRRDAELASLNERLYDSMLSLEGQSLGTLQALSAAVDEKDAYTARHSIGVTNWAYQIGASAGLSAVELATLERAGLLHDIGKIGVPESVLLKPERLSDEEFALIREHPDAGARILETIPFLDDIVNVVRYHHERWDGKGYPEGLAGEEIPYLARVLAVADAYDAMITDRPYRKAMPAEEARKELLDCAGTQFDPAIVALFVSGGAVEAA